MALRLNYNFFTFILNKFFFIKWSFKKIFPIIIQEILTKNILMFAWINNYNLLKIFSIFLLYYYSRSKFKFWFKGLSSYNFQSFKYFYIDCDMDCGLFKIIQFNNKSCHTNNNSCFFNKL
ncbi:Phosphoribosyl-AMP cyclohydrolase [Candidatus Nasuia deltocephalinicola]|nr:Phosphoribosyl-AMP cyclohydrolase [Candidatus Nasuia deltocephalinicola]